MYNLKILCARQSACELHNHAPSQWLESWHDAIQWPDLSFSAYPFFLFFVDLAYRFRHYYGHSCWRSQNKTLSQHQILVCTHLERCYSVNFLITYLVESHVGQAKFCLWVCQVVFPRVLRFSPHLPIDPSRYE